MRAFGVGCWSFEPVGARAGDAKGVQLALDESAYFAAIKQSLQEIPSISAVEVPSKTHFVMFGGEDDDDDDDDGSSSSLRGRRFVPHPSGGSMAFSVYVPEAAQLAVYPQPLGIGERFEVLIVFTETFPVAYVTCLEPAGGAPSSAVFFLREFIRGELARRKAPIQLRVVGPSPWWASFYLVSRFEATAATGDDEPEADLETVSATDSHGAVSIRRIRQRVGYDTILCAWDQDVHDEGTAWVATRTALEGETGLRYELSCSSQFRLRRGIRIDNELRDLIALHEGEGIRTSIERWWRGGRLSRRVSLKVVKLQASAAAERDRALESIQELSSRSRPTVLREVVEEELRQASDVERSGTRDIVTLLESRRAADVNVLVLVFSSLVGAGVGSAVTTLLTR